MTPRERPRPACRALRVGTAQWARARTPPNREDKHSGVRQAGPASGCGRALTFQMAPRVSSRALSEPPGPQLPSLPHLLRNSAPDWRGSQLPGRARVFSPRPPAGPVGVRPGLAGPPSWRREPLQARQPFVPSPCGTPGEGAELPELRAPRPCPQTRRGLPRGSGRGLWLRLHPRLLHVPGACTRCRRPRPATALQAGATVTAWLYPRQAEQRGRDLPKRPHGSSEEPASQRPLDCPRRHRLGLCSGRGITRGGARQGAGPRATPSGQDLDCGAGARRWL